MSKFDIRLAEVGDTDSISELFLEQFPFLKDCEDGARKDVLHRLTREDSVTVVASSEGRILGVARGYEHESVYLMNSICTSSSISLLVRSRVLLALLPFFVKTCIKHAEKLGLAKAFYSTEVKSLSRLVPVLCDFNKFYLTPGNHNGEEGFWISRAEGGR